MKIQNYIFAGVITSLMFLAAFVLTDELHEQQVIDISGIRTDLSLSLVDQEMQADLLSAASCDNHALFDEQLNELGSRISVLESQRGWSDEGVQQLKKDYTLLQMRDYLALLERNERCSVTDPVEYFVAFVRHDECEDCSDTWQMLWTYKQLKPTTKVYIFDVDVSLASMQTLMNSFAVTKDQTPVILQNGEIISNDELLALIRTAENPPTEAPIESDDSTR